MTTAAPVLDAQRPAGLAWAPNWRLMQAELLKLTRRRGLMIAAVALTVGAVVAYFGITAGLHASDPSRYGPAGGMRSLGHTADILQQLGAVSAILLGASVGAADVTSGVFRNLVTTGRSRVALFLARVPTGIGVTITIALAAYALGAACTVLLAGSQQAPPTHIILAGGAWLVLDVTMAFLLALGLSALTGSQSTSIAILLALTLVVTPLVARIGPFPGIRQALPGIALDQLEPRALGPLGSGSPAMTGAAIAVVLGIWAAVSLAAGAWRTATRDA